MKKIYLLLLALPFVLWACPAKKDPPAPVVVKTPKVCFTVAKTLFDSGEAVQFTNCSTDAGSYVWDFGEGITKLSTETNPSHVFGPTRTGFHVKLTAYSTDADKSKYKDSATTVYEGFRQIDSVNLISVPGFVSGTDILFQMGPAQNVSMYSAPDKVVNTLPTTFVFAAGTVKITSANNNSWAGHIFNNVTKQSIYPWGGAKNVFFSRGLNASPIDVNDGFGLHFKVYYSLVKN